MEMFTNCIYKFIWHLLHRIVSLYEYCFWVRLRITAFAFWSYDRCRSTPDVEKVNSDYDFLKQCKKKLSKIPKHLNLIIGPENTQVTDELLVQIISYALHMNINCISYYDTRYTNTKSSNTYLTVLDKLKCPKGWRRKDIDSCHSLWYADSLKEMSNADSVINSNLTNGHTTPSVEIFEIKPHHNRPLLAQVCCGLFNQRHTNEIQNLLKERTLLMERIDQDISNHLGNITEPELSIIFDENLCTFGMLPWHTRFTEFHRHAKGSVFNAKTFVHILCKYSRCEQRWGK